MTELAENIQAAEVRLPCTDLKEDLPFYTKTLGFRLDTIFPADDPAVAVLSGYGLRIRLERGAKEAPGTLRLLCRTPETVAKSMGDYNGTAKNQNVKPAERKPEWELAPIMD